ncbi:hypothetical protein [Staphylococcus argenteus]|uniref:hypothetical protein n=1 Tax=Staphylococcus argenteus TaxID=985002 RepID=UPI001FBB0EF0|nr:hypothetical protein [Staphylococcus argenteus]MCG9794339.1 hypothetical protein [Staphylococcus argenteus]GJF43805.1 hypothetical protein SA19061_08950 [Staphylococcus argenteus]GJF54033.1 hypothetical protein SA19088_07760 [Staphylococcus argenteus]GJF59465.1 hypothetical protein SA19105_09530 [Staphylococcus argenteus]GJF72366.1 hypothetical protein SA19202_09740 [Staphylococcus argenteus]
MKIKVKKEMTLDELIKWAWDNPELVRGKKFYPQGKSDSNYVYFHLLDGRKCIMREYISADDTFEVEVEEEITEETKFYKLLEVFKDDADCYNSTIHTDISIKERMDSKCFPIESFYILNDDLTMTLIWKNGELLE